MSDEPDRLYGDGERDTIPMMGMITPEECRAQAERAKGCAIPLLHRAEELKRLYDQSKAMAEFWGKIGLAYLMMSGMGQTDAEKEVKSWRPFRE